MKVNTTTLKKLVPIASNLVEHYCKCAARLYGKLALRSQLDYESVSGNYSSIEMVEMDREKLKQEIIKIAHDCAKTTRRLNAIAEKHGFPRVMPNIDELSLSEFVSVMNKYVEELVAESDYRSFLAEMKTFDNQGK